MLEDMKELKEDKIIIDNILNNKKAIKRLAPICHYKNIQLNKKFFDKALNKILKADSKLSKKEKSDLFRQTLEYYSLPQNISVPIYHSTSSYTLRKALEE
jgi:hypothetical protein